MPSIQQLITAPITAPQHAGTAQKPDGEAFGQVLAQAMGGVEKFRRDADAAVNSFLTGETQEIHQVILAGQRSEIAFEAFLQVRNKVVQAYQEVMRMQL
jgi:flagellar hook-basal body complex protein FliE